MTTAACPLAASKRSKTASPREKRPQTSGISCCWLLKTLTLVMCLQQFASHPPAGVGGGGVSAAPTHTIAPTLDPAAELLNSYSSNSTRLKRQLSFTREHFQLALNKTDKHLDWAHTCDAKLTRRREKQLHPHKKQRVLLRILQNQTRREFRAFHEDDKQRHWTSMETARGTEHNRFFNNSRAALKKWQLHHSHYAFLPKLQVAQQTKLSLRKVHRDLQFYVAAFSYLWHAQLYSDFKNLQYQSVISGELFRLRRLSRDILCHVDGTIIGINRAFSSGPHLSHKTRSLIPFKTVPKPLMELQLLKLKSNVVDLNRNAVLYAQNKPAAEPQPINLNDVRFIKFEFLQYLRHTLQILNKSKKQLTTAAPRPYRKRTKLPHSN